ncbi:MAG: hypothetical protein NW200_11130 [Hyphomonadaceae bacterium]|nr:hypothetical protein [Hyphomonadaceae bacterium]
MRGSGLVAVALLLSACAGAHREGAVTSLTAVEPDSDPLTLQIEIGRYSALLGQVVEHTGVSYDHVGEDGGEETDAGTLMAQLSAAVRDYNAVRSALCASKTTATTYQKIRADSCGAQYRPDWPSVPITNGVVAQRSSHAGRPIVSLWVDVCEEARRLQPAGQEDEPVCPME